MLNFQNVGVVATTTKVYKVPPMTPVARVERSLTLSRLAKAKKRQNIYCDLPVSLLYHNR